MKCLCTGPCHALTPAHHAVARMGPRPRGYWTWVLKGGGARTHGLTKHTERVRTYHGTHGTVAPIGYYPVSHRARRVLGGDSRAYGNRVRCGVVRARAAPGASDTVLERQSEPWSVLLTTHTVLGGHSRGTHGAVERAVRGTRHGNAQSKSARGGTANDTEYPTALGHYRGLLLAYSRPRAARACARQCDGACGRAACAQGGRTVLSAS